MTVMRDTDVPLPREADGAFKIKREAFDLMMALVGAHTDAEIADVIDMHTRTVQRAREGQFGGEFMKNTVIGLRKHQEKLSRYGQHPTLGNLFEVA